MTKGARVLEAHALRREFARGRVAVENVSLTVGGGEVLCLLGPNGAGKTTTVKMVSTLLTPTGGSVMIEGVDALSNPREARRRLGVVLGGDRGFYMRASAKRNLQFFADVLGVPRKIRDERVNNVLDRVALSDRAGSPVREYSRGMLQRLHIARGLLNEPALLLLDEPTNGLDPEIARDVRGLVRDLSSCGVGVLLTTHYLHEAEQLADRVMVIKDGRELCAGSVAHVVESSGVAHVTSFSLDTKLAGLAEALGTIDGTARIDQTERDGISRISVSWRGTPLPGAIRTELERRGLDVPADMATRRASLEESYLALIEGA